MAKKPNTKPEEESIDSEEVPEQEDIESISFVLPYQSPFYILEISGDDVYSVFNTLEGAVKYIDELENIETKNIKLLGFNRDKDQFNVSQISYIGFNRDKDQFNVSQISWARIYQISRNLRKNEG